MLTDFFYEVGLVGLGLGGYFVDFDPLAFCDYLDLWISWDLWDGLVGVSSDFGLDWIGGMGLGLGFGFKVFHTL